MERKVNRYVAPTFVPAAHERPAPARAAQQHELQLHQPVQLANAARSELDRALAFIVSTAGLSFIVGLGGALIAAGAWGAPLLSATTLAVFFATSMIVWLASWTAHLLLSETGIALVALWLQYRLLRHEQIYRHEPFDE